MAAIGISIRPKIMATAPERSRANLLASAARRALARDGQDADPLRIPAGFAVRVHVADMRRTLLCGITQLGATLGSIRCPRVNNID